MFSQDGTALTFSKKDATNLQELKNRKVITTVDGVSYVLTNKLGFINTITEIKNGEQTTVYKTPTIVLLVEVAFWEGNLLLVVCVICLRNVVFPVPAFPVKNTDLLVDSTYLSANSKISSFSISL